MPDILMAAGDVKRKRTKGFTKHLSNACCLPGTLTKGSHGHASQQRIMQSGCAY